MIEGLFKATYATPLGVGVAVVTLANGTLQGGDPALYYVGSYCDAGDRFTCDFKTARHTQMPGVTSVFGRDDVSVHVEGTTSPDRINGTGSSPNAPGLTFNVTLERLRPI